MASEVAEDVKALWQAIARAEQEVLGDALTYSSMAHALESALTTAEARGRQQAEQRYFICCNCGGTAYEMVPVVDGDTEHRCLKCGEAGRVWSKAEDAIQEWIKGHVEPELLRERLQQAEQERDAAQKAMSYTSEQAHLEWTRAEKAEAQVAALTQALKDIAAHKLCEDEPEKCYQDSGPYCGKHIFDDHLVKIARAALTGAQA